MSYNEAQWMLENYVEGWVLLEEKLGVALLLLILHR